MQSARLEPAKLILIGTRTTYQATGDAGTTLVGNIRAVEVRIFGPSGPYISVQSVRGSVTHSIEQLQREVDGGLRTAGSDKHNQPYMGVSHTHGAWAAAL